MSAYFWVATIIMTVVAVVALLQPLMKSGKRSVILGLAVAVPLVAASLYLLLGSPSVASGRSTAYDMSLVPGSSTSSRPAEKVASVSSMVDGLAARLEQDPDDGKGWLLLARSYRHLNRFDDAAAAYARAAALGERDAELDTLSASPTEAAGAQIFGNVRLSENAAAIVESGDTVFIFARAVDGGGAPAAVLQRPASELPIDFLLNDSQSMVPGVRLSDFDVVEVTARISRSGIASEALKGLEARSGPVTIANEKHLQLVIE